MTNEKPISIYRTHDLPLAGVIALSFMLDQIEVVGRRAIFCFRDEIGLAELVEKYYNRKVEVEPMEYQETIRRLREEMYKTLGERGRIDGRYER